MPHYSGGKKNNNTTFTDETRSGYWIFCTFWKVRTLWKSLAFMESRFPFQPREELLPPWWGENGSVSRPVLINTWIHEYGSGSHRRLMRCRVQSFGLGLFSLEWTGCSTLLNNNKTRNCLYRQKNLSSSHFTPPISFFLNLFLKKYAERYLSTMILIINNLHIFSPFGSDGYPHPESVV